MKMNQQIRKTFIAAVTFAAALVGFLFFQNFSNPLDLTQPGQQNSTTIAKGQILGSCMYQLNEYFQPTTLPSADPAINISWPIISCDSAGKATCAAGFDVIAETPVQMNCSTDPSNYLQNCYWSQFRCASTSGSVNVDDFIRGQEYGNVLAEYDANYQVTKVHDLKWPMLSFNNGVAICASGFDPVKTTPVQFNCATNPSKYNVVNCFEMTTRCMKL